MELVLQEPGQQPLNRSRSQRLKEWLVNCYLKRNIRDKYVWRVATGSLACIGSLSICAAALGMPTGLGVIIDVLLFILLNAVAMGLAAVLLSFIFSMLYLPLPRRFAAVCVYVCLQIYIILYYAELGIMMSAIIAITCTFIGTLAGCLLGLLARMRMKAIGKAAIVLSLAAVLAIVYGLANRPGPAQVTVRGELADYGLIEALNPAEAGSYTFQSFTYGSGQDKHRSWFGSGVDVRTASVDASSYITRWPYLKKLFWGFDEQALPINGTVWMPEGEGSFPLALIVHGNHLMEHFSDGGYAYLGELLASKGIIAVSVDENFLNYSVWSGIPNDDMKMRAWVLLKHLQQIQQLSAQEGNPFADRVDLHHVALVGHSRGGQAVAMAADWKSWFEEDTTLESVEQVRITSVIAIAPTDKKVDEKQAYLSDVSYLTLQGARDADVNNFYGERQYNRVDFKQQSDAFKAALYIGDANHSQFNTDWGRLDDRLPGGLFLNRDGLLEEEEQREISKVYVSAFLQTTLLGQDEYRPIFRDYRTALSWLPDTLYINRYEEAGFTEIARYEDSGRKTVITGGGRAAADGMTEWRIAAAEDRDGNNKGTKGIELEWAEPGAQYELQLPPDLPVKAADMTEAGLVFSMALLEPEELLSAALKENADQGSDTELPLLPEIEIELVTAAGDAMQLELLDVMPVTPVPSTVFTTLPWLEGRMKNEKYKESVEPVFQTYVLPIEHFGDEEQQIAVTDIDRITFRFTSGPGKVMIDDIGFMPL